MMKQNGAFKPRKVIKVHVGKVPKAEQEIMARLINENKYYRLNRFKYYHKE